MSLNKDDILKVGYKAKIEWYKERMFNIADGKITLDDYLKEKNPDFEAQDHTPDELIEILGDLSKKIVKLEDKISFLSFNLRIPVDKEKEPEIAQSVQVLDPNSRGEYITYTLYDSILREQEYVDNSLDLNYLVENSSIDIFSGSMSIQDKIYQSYAEYNKQTSPQDNSIERYANSWLNSIVSWNEHDYQIRQILNFSDNYLDTYPDPAYVPWSFRRDMGTERLNVDSNSDLIKHFSENYSQKVGDVVNGVGSLMTLRPDKSINDLTARYIDYTNHFLNKVNEILDTDILAELVCCFMQWGIRLDTKTLKGLRAILQLLQTGLTFDFKDVLNGVKDIINNIFRGLLCNQLVGLIKQVIQSISDPIKRWLNDPQDDVWKKVFNCTAIDELINKFIVQAIDYLEKLLVKLIENWYKKIELGSIKNGLKLELKSNQKWIGTFSKLLDTIIAVAEKAAQCGLENSPNSEGVQNLIRSYSLDNPSTTYVFPEEENPNIYNSFIPTNPDDPTSGSADATRTTKNDLHPITGPMSSDKVSAMEQCLKKIPADQISGVKEWIDIINSKSQGRT